MRCMHVQVRAAYTRVCCARARGAESAEEVEQHLVRVGVRLRVRVRVNLVLLDGTLDADPLAPRHLRAEEDHLVGSEGWGCGERVGAGPGVGRPAARGC